MTDQTRYPQQRGNSSPQARSGSEGRFSRRAEDPLAELARLIGQDDPFAEFNNPQRATPSRSQATPVARRPANGNGSLGSAYPRAERRDDHYDHYEADDYQQAANDFDRVPEPAYAREYQDDDRDFEAPKIQRAPVPQNFGRAYSYGGTLAARAEQPARPSKPAARQPLPDLDDDYDDPRYARQDADGYDADYRHTRGYEGDPRYDESPYDGQDYAPEYEQEYAPDDYPQDEYAEPVRDKRRWMLIGAMSLIGVIVLGVTGIYGYRAVFKKHTASNPPTIRSAETPTKVVPPASQATPDGTKQNYDRIGEQPPAGGERVVSREEQPAINANPGSRTVTTTPIGPQPGGSVSAFAAPAQATPALTPPPSALNQGNGEPKRVRTVTVRADGTVVDPRRTPPVRGNTPMALNPNVQTDPQDSPDDQPPPRGAARPSSQQAYADPAPSRAGNYAPAGSYVVQVSSQKNEQDAQTAWRQLQAKYTNVLGNAQVTFKRVDLGDRGTFYRAMVGPFANRDQAYEMCQNLKSAGGECVVQRN
jgi:hypothetical protein